MRELDDPRPPDEEERLKEFVLILHRLWTYSLTTKSDEARVFADHIAEAASRGFITTAIVPGGSLHGRLWKLTPAGTQFLFDHPPSPQALEARYVEKYCAQA